MAGSQCHHAGAAVTVRHPAAALTASLQQPAKSSALQLACTAASCCSPPDTSRRSQLSVLPRHCVQLVEHHLSHHDAAIQAIPALLIAAVLSVPGAGCSTVASAGEDPAQSLAGETASTGTACKGRASFASAPARKRLSYARLGPAGFDGAPEQAAAGPACRRCSGQRRPQALQDTQPLQGRRLQKVPHPAPAALLSRAPKRPCLALLIHTSLPLTAAS